MARALARMNGGEPAAEPVAAAEEPAAEPEAETAPEPAAPVVEQRPGESDARFEARLARAMADLQKKDAALLGKDTELKTEREQAAAAKADLAKAMAELDRLKKDPVAALKLHGGYDEITRRVLAEEIKAPTAEDVLKTQVEESTSAVKAEIEAIKAELEAAKAAKLEHEQRTQAEQARAKDLETVKSRFTSLADKFPLATSVWSAERVLDLCYQQGEGDVDAVVGRIEQAARADVESVLSNPKALTALLQNKKIRETILSAIGSKDQSRKNPTSSEGPRALAADVVSAPTTPTNRPKTREERMKVALAMVHKA